MTAAAASQPQKRWLNKKEAASYLGVSERWVKRALSEGTLPYHKLRKLVRLDVHDLDAYVKSNRIDPGEK
jgi:excisionase family DNA binding protein